MVLKVCPDPGPYLLTTSAICVSVFAVYINKYMAPNVDIGIENLQLNYTSVVYCDDKDGGEPVELEKLYGGAKPHMGGLRRNC
jgi:hypothetical protein